ncbi:MAG: hypothetical protein OXK73_16055 [Rhodospirillaceae bacterium]|nr:hypothetical protein [Rhodospirillaceae bacterium]
MLVFNAHYLTYFDTAITEFFRALPYDYQGQVERRGEDYHTVKTLVEYYAPIRFDDEIEVGVRAARIGRSSPSVRVWSTKTRPAAISILRGAVGSPVCSIEYFGSASPISSPSGGTASVCQSSCGANVTRMSPSAASGAPAGAGSGLKPSCQSCGRAALIACTARTVWSTSSGGVPSATRTVGGLMLKRRSGISRIISAGMPSSSSPV